MYDVVQEPIPNININLCIYTYMKHENQLAFATSRIHTFTCKHRHRTST